MQENALIFENAKRRIHRLYATIAMVLAVVLIVAFAAYVDFVVLISIIIGGAGFINLFRNRDLKS